MKIYYECNHCNPKTKVEIGRRCEICKVEAYRLSIELKKDDTYYDFCSLKHLLKFTKDEIKKENPETRFITGKEN